MGYSYIWLSIAIFFTWYLLRRLFFIVRGDWLQDVEQKLFWVAHELSSHIGEKQTQFLKVQYR